MKILSVGAKFFHADGQTDIQIYMTKDSSRFSQVYERA
jgi:hypothetical protein